MSLPKFGHLEIDRNLKVSEPIGRAVFLDKGRHLIIGQRERRGQLDSLIYIGKCIEHNKIGDRYDANVWLDVSFPHVVFIAGTRGSGKSFDIGVLVEGLMLPASTKVSTNQRPMSIILFDLQDQFWTLSRPPDPTLPEDENHLKQLATWALQPTPLDRVKLLVPPGRQKALGTEQELILPTSDLTADDLCSSWNTDIYTPQGHLISQVIDKVARSGYQSVQAKATGQTSDVHVPPRDHYTIDDLIACVRNDSEILERVQPQVVDAVNWRLESLRDTGLFRATGVAIQNLLQEKAVSVLLLRSLDDATKALVTGIVLRKVSGLMGDYHSRRKLLRRLKKTAPDLDLPERVWCIVDEAHVVCPSGQETSATRSVIEYVKRGRDAGLSLALATQQPSAVDSRVLSQVDLTLVHRLTFEGDIAAALARIPAHLPSSFTVGTLEKEPRMIVRLLESGEAILGESQSDRAFLVRVRPRVTAHGGAEPK